SGGGGRGADSKGDRRGRAFGREVHDFAERYARREGAIDPLSVDGEDVANVVALLDPLIADSDADLRVEENVYLPLAVDGERVTISGTADLVVVREDRVEILDYKTDLDRRAEPEYRKQVSVYYHVAREVFPDRDIRLGLFYTAAGEVIDIEPMDKSELVRVLEG
ncbi:MAG: PD-(D/E)XK nuclease family protein, partial [Halodesulfurarchaeum sp.]